MTKSNWNFERRDKQNLYEEVFDITTGHSHDGADSRLIAYQTYAAGISSVNAATGATVNVAVAQMRATDAILASLISSGTAAYVLTVAQISTASFRVTMNTACGLCTISYAVLRAS